MRMRLLPVFIAAICVSGVAQGQEAEITGFTPPLPPQADQPVAQSAEIPDDLFGPDTLGAVVETETLRPEPVEVDNLIPVPIRTETVRQPEAIRRVERVLPVDAEIEAPRFAAPTTESDVRKSRMSAAELRQARALYRSKQRISRLEYNLWMGQEPLRPNWNSVPMMSSRYGSRKIYVPVYIHTR